MSVMVVKYDAATMARFESVLRHIPKGLQVASFRSINRALIAGRTALSKQVRAVYTIKASDIKGTLKLNKASSSLLEGELSSKGKALPLTRFQHRPQEDTTGANRKRIAVTIKKGQAKALATGFKSEKLHGNIFHRTAQHGKIRRPLTVSVPQMIENDVVQPEIADRMNDMFWTRMDHEVNHILQKGKA